MVEGARVKNKGHFLYHLEHDVPKTARRLEPLHIKNTKKNNLWPLPKPVYIYISFKQKIYNDWSAIKPN